MLDLVQIEDHSYEIHDNKSGASLATFEAYSNPLHEGHAYLKPDLKTSDSSLAKEIFSLLYKEIARPMQIMTYSTPELYIFLTAGGFVRRRRCLEIEVTVEDRLMKSLPELSLVSISKGQTLYEEACRMLYNYYKETHRAVNPLTADLKSFSQNLPNFVLAQVEEGQILHLAFVEEASDETEIAYVATTDLSSFEDFSYKLTERLFEKSSGLFFECDDTDPAAMVLKSCFAVEDPISFDTYVYEV